MIFFSNGHRRSVAAPLFGAAFLLAFVASAQALPTVDVVYSFTISGHHPEAALVLGSDGALYGSTREGGSYGYGTLFKIDATGTFTLLHSFDRGVDGAEPSAALTLGTDGALYGSTSEGGVYGTGTLFKVDPSGKFTSLHSFDFGVDGGYPLAALALGSDGALYGSTSEGGSYISGTLFKIDPSGAFTLLHSFDYSVDGSYPTAALVLGSDGALYGSTSSSGSGGEGDGTLFKIDATGAFTLLHSFNGSDGGSPEALALGSDGALYGSTGWGGSYGYGTLFKIDPSGRFTSLHNFNGSDGASGSSVLALGSDGALYGSTSQGGGYSYGTLFKLDPSGTFTSLHSFDRSVDGAGPFAVLALGSDGALYGSTPIGGGSDAGTLFKIDPSGTFTSLHSFDSIDGNRPRAALALGSDGALYGSTRNGGTASFGTLFKIDPSGTFASLHSFDSEVGGAHPLAALARGSDGALYGSTSQGGSYGDGTLFKIDPNGTLTSLHSFNGSDGASPRAALALGSDGALYGSTYSGGALPSRFSYGTLFKIDPSGTFTSLHSFNRDNGSSPEVPLALGSDGALYGSTGSGGSRGYGTLFKINPSGTFTSLHSFNGLDGSAPQAALVLGSDGALYGSTYSGTYSGTNSSYYGTLFKIDPNRTFTSLHKFDLNDGRNPSAALTLGSDGALYGSIPHGGSYGHGTLFKIDPSGTFTLLHSFNGSDGAIPLAALVLGGDGALYGSTFGGGSSHYYGTLFKIDPNGTFTSLHSFDDRVDGAYPRAALALGSDGALYGSTSAGGSSNDGTLFKIDPTGTFTSLHSFDGSDGDGPRAALALGSDGALYGTTQRGGPGGGGVLFRLGHELFDFDGFYSPVDNLPIVNHATAGAAVPVRFSLAENPETDVVAPGSPTSSTIPCDATAPIGRVEATRTANLSGLMYSATGIYTYVWKTEKAWAGTCREFVLELTDGSTHRAHFKFTRRRPRRVELRQ